MARIFNTFGPRMHFNDGNVCACLYVCVSYKTDFIGRVVSNFIIQALQSKNLTVEYTIYPVYNWYN